MQRRVPCRTAATCLMRGIVPQPQRLLSSFSCAGVLLGQPACLTLLRRAFSSSATATCEATTNDTAVMHRFMSSRLSHNVPVLKTPQRRLSTMAQMSTLRTPHSMSWTALRPHTYSSGFLPAKTAQTRFYSSTHNYAIYTLRHTTSSKATHGARFSIGSPSATLLAPKKTTTTTTTSSSSSSSNLPQVTNTIDRYRSEEENEEERRRREAGGGEESEEDMFNRNAGPGYLPFRAPFHTINIVMILLIANVLCYAIMNFTNDDWRDWLVEHCTMSHENWWRIYPIFTNALYQENLLQLLIDCWLLMQFGETMLNFLGNVRLTFFALLCTATGSMIHIARQKFELYYGKDELEVRGRCYGPNPFIMGLIAVEGLIFRHLNFIQQPPVPFLVLTAFVMVIDVWRIFTILPEEHGAATGGALVAYLFWALPTRMLGLDKLTAAL